MKVSLLVIGKTTEPFVKSGLELYVKRIVHYVKFDIIEIPNVKSAANLPVHELKRLEGEEILKRIDNQDYFMLLDEKGRLESSRKFSESIQKIFNQGVKGLTVCVGGAFGFSDAVYQRANAKVSLSTLTFPHQLVRVIFAEQLYRALTILKGEDYHHD